MLTQCYKLLKYVLPFCQGWHGWLLHNETTGINYIVVEFPSVLFLEEDFSGSSEECVHANLSNKIITRGMKSH